MFKKIKNKLYNYYLVLKYAKKLDSGKLERLKQRSFPYVGDSLKLAKMDSIELIEYLKKILGKNFKNFFKKSISIPTIEEVLEKIKKEG